MNKKPIHKLKKMFEEKEMTRAMMEELRSDKRKGVQRLLEIYERKRQLEEKQKQDFLMKQKFDAGYRVDGDDLLAGVDEAGRGPLAGPVVAAAVILPHDFKLLGLDDSKQLTEMERNALCAYIKRYAISYSIQAVSASEIDCINIYEATKKAMKKSLLALETRPNMALVDAVKLDGLHFPAKAVIKGDAKSLAIGAASILAKVARDGMMDELDKAFPEYGFGNHKGYGTKQHIDALKKYGPTEYHRKSFVPVQNLQENVKKTCGEMSNEK